METLTINLHKYQDQAIFAQERFIALIAGLQSGKSTAGAIWSRIQFDTFPKDDGLIAAPTYKILQSSTLPKFFQTNPDLKKYYKKADSVIDIPERGRIYIRSTENPNVLEGMMLRWAWFDEGGAMKVDAWINIQGRLSILQGKLFITTTPYAMNWLYTDFYAAFKRKEKDYLVVQFQSIDNPYFPKEEFHRVRSTMDQRVFERRYMGLFTKMEGLVYPDFNQQYMVVKELPTSFDFVIAGIDWGFTNPTAISIWGQKERQFYLIDEFYETGKTTPELIEHAQILREKYKINRWYADGAEPDRIAEFRKNGLPVIEGNKDIEMGVNRFRQLIKDNRIRVKDTCVHFLDEIERYHYPEIKDGITNKETPEKVDDHLMDCTRYIFATYAGSAIPTNIRRYNDHFPLNKKMKRGIKSGYTIKMA